MNRLLTRLVLAMMAVATISLVIVPVAQTLAVRNTIANLPADFRQRIESQARVRTSEGGDFRFERRGTAPDVSAGDPRSPAAPPGGAAVASREFLSAENVRLYAFVGDFRAAQERAVAFGSLTALLLAIVSAVWLSRGIARPIEAISRAAGEIAQGRFGARVVIPNLQSRSDETRRLARNFNTMAEALERYEGNRKAMIADIAHELRNPLATLQLRIDALSDGLVTFDESEAQLLRGQVSLMSRLIDDLRTLSLADAGNLSIDMESVDLDDLLRSVVQANEGRARAAEVDLVHEHRTDDCRVNVDASRVAQVLNNLIDNALRVTPRGGLVRVGVTSGSEYVTIYVRDTGPGIPEHELGTIFERYVQSQRRDTKSTAGSGLGLAIVRTLVEMHGGTVQAANLEDGAEFTVRLPIRGATAASA